MSGPQRVADAGVDCVCPACRSFGHDRGQVVDGIDIVARQTDQRIRCCGPTITQGVDPCVAGDRLGQCVAGKVDRTCACGVVGLQELDLGSGTQSVGNRTCDRIRSTRRRFCHDRSGVVDKVDIRTSQTDQGIRSTGPTIAQGVGPGVAVDRLPQNVAGQVDRRGQCRIVSGQDLDIRRRQQGIAEPDPHFVCGAVAGGFSKGIPGVAQEIHIVSGQTVQHIACADPAIKDVVACVAVNRLGQCVAGQVD